MTIAANHRPSSGVSAVLDPPLREGQMWQQADSAFRVGGPKYHILALWDEWVWYLVHYPGVSAQRQPDEPRTTSPAFFGRMRCIYDPVRASS